MKQLIIPILLLLASCTAVEEGKVKPPLVYRIDIQQGNVVEQEMVAKLKVGMDEKQVKFIMGTPLLIDPFHPERWEYIFSYQKGGKRREQRHVTLHFDDNQKLKGISGDIKVSHLPIEVDDHKSEKSIVVPEGYNDDTLFEKLMPEFGDDNKKTIKKKKKKRKSDYEYDNTLEAEVAEERPKEKVIDKELEEALEKTDEQRGVSDEELAEEIELAKELMAEDKPQPEAISESEGKSNDEEESGFFSRMWDKITNDEEKE